MEYQKEAGPANIDIVTSATGVAMKFAIAQSLGGGSAAGVIQAKAEVEIDVGAAQALDLVDALLKAHFPGMASVIDGIVAAGKAELAKI